MTPAELAAQLERERYARPVAEYRPSVGEQLAALERVQLVQDRLDADELELARVLALLRQGDAA